VLLEGEIKQPIRWLQPTGVNESFPIPIGDNNWIIDYSRIEVILWKVQTDKSGQLLINAETSTILEQVHAQLPENMSQIEWQRLTWVLEKSFVSSHGKQLAHLLSRYSLYQQEYATSLALLHLAKGDEKHQLLQGLSTQNEQLQTRFFGADIAKKLFAKQNTTINYLNARRILNLRSDLSQTEKNQRLLKLKKQYQASLSRSSVMDEQ
jgi:hypothetical protein